VTKPQSYTPNDLTRGAQIVSELHGCRGFYAWAEHVAKALAAERERAETLATKLARDLAGSPAGVVLTSLANILRRGGEP
jgi:hypothetical protein